jgi:hypothetical protein
LDEELADGLEGEEDREDELEGAAVDLDILQVKSEYDGVGGGGRTSVRTTPGR